MAEHLERQPSRREEIIELATEERHDADIPTNIGSIRTIHTRKPTESAESSTLKLGEKDIEKGPIASSLSSSKRDAEDEEVIPEDEEGINEPNIVTWDSPTDPENPMNWTLKKKWGTVALVSVITFLTPLASSMFAPGVPDVMHTFHSTNDMLTGFMVSVYVLGFAFGPLIVAPLSEMYGRLPLYHTCNVLFTVFTIAAAVSTNMTMFIFFRFFMGCFGGAPNVLGGGTIADLISREQRGTAMAVWMMGPTLGPCVGPIIGGFLTGAKGWRWNFWFVAICSGACTVMLAVLMKETSAPVILARKTKRLIKETGNTKLRSKLDNGLSPRDLFLFSIIRPTKMLTRSLICFLISLYISIIYAYLYILFTTFTAVFTTRYHFSSGAAGLSFLGLGLGSVLGQFVFTHFGNRTVRKHMEKGDFRPEHRLWIMAFGGLALPVGLFWYGWAVEGDAHWIVGIVGTGFVGFGMMMSFMPASTYLVDVFTVYAASAMAANTVMRSLFAALIPLSSQKMYAALGYGWGNSLLGFVSLLLIPIPFLFIRYGERIRKRNTVKF
ncbi:MFS general substrate transporter [Delitschia confertaspora ATCC 74209]|uniref:MFS general substrate transporter n=1 Tax=Delitschia confertaspora ATCC 74209 TaxID=1513339 RepID=A0A9P4JEX9_9PLEO|nr:MFS general substrate transporter [Delitschia confertaspora ATCC 74209]